MEILRNLGDPEREVRLFRLARERAFQIREVSRRKKKKRKTNEDPRRGIKYTFRNYVRNGCAHSGGDCTMGEIWAEA